MKELKSVAQVAESVLKDIGLKKAVELWNIYGIFKNIFASEIVDNIKIVGLSNGMLTVKVPSSVWVQELSFFESQIIKEIGESVGKNIVKRIKFTEV